MEELLKILRDCEKQAAKKKLKGELVAVLLAAIVLFGVVVWFTIRDGGNVFTGFGSFMLVIWLLWLGVIFIKYVWRLKNYNRSLYKLLREKAKDVVWVYVSNTQIDNAKYVFLYFVTQDKKIKRLDVGEKADQITDMVKRVMPWVDFGYNLEKQKRYLG